MPRKERLPKNVSAFVDARGKLRYRFRKTGYETKYFTAHPNSQAGKEELRAFLTREPIAAERYPVGTVGYVAARYFASPAFTGGKGVLRKRNARRILETFIGEFARDRLENFRFDHIEAVLTRTAKPRVEAGRKRGGPSAARNLTKELRPFFAYGLKLLELRQPNPVDQAAKVAVPKTTGFHSWDEVEIAQYRARHPLGTMARLALETALWTWQRLGDVATFGPKHLKDGRINYTQGKTGKDLWLPAAPQLLAAIDAMPVVGTRTFIVTEYGNPFTVAGLGNKMREWCDQAGLPQCTMHGLRKAGARRAAEWAKATNQQLKAVGGWSGDSEVGLYTAAAEQALMAEQALGPVIAADLANARSTSGEQ